MGVWGSESIICGCEGRLRWYVCERGVLVIFENARKSQIIDLEAICGVWWEKVKVFGESSKEVKRHF